MSYNSCCFIGHRHVENKTDICKLTKLCIKNILTANENLKNFYFGSRSAFNEICLQIVTELKNKYPNLIRIYVRAEYEFISQEYENNLLQIYDKTFYSTKAKNANRLAYIKRNEEIIDSSDICVFYYTNKTLRSGTYIALNYAKKHNKKIIIIP